ncbi:dTDP-4-dehydrorhamnose reductase [Aquimarina algicola]|uniref:dTDP-4-dehydrorhamnose reductase n=1 Tax=Aquimarina algicola TaxID=2589995 RepID=A0A504JMF6_9FLAO|nr:dTDP-4-dehydrorhamnose reductase [Aquimarina algicola]TPN87871.1 dTDP-4-dehydrorhamnose reductase [Aquimarina algicola]
MQEKSKKNKVLVTGSDGQLGQCLKKIKNSYLNLDFHFTNSKSLNIVEKDKIEHLFSEHEFDFVINCAAYTNVEQAEKEPTKAFLINAEGVKNLAEVCKKHKTTLIHISTDYVFDGKKKTPYTEEDLPNPINEYGKSKRKGEEYIEEILESYFIIRTSWLYSEFGKNFYKTIIEKSKTEKELTITTSEIGTPTNANDLARFVLDLIQINDKKYGIYHYSNLGEATWYEFAKEILKLLGKHESVMLKKTNNYPTFAVRPEYSVLSKEKTLEIFNTSILNWALSMSEIDKFMQ